MYFLEFLFNVCVYESFDSIGATSSIDENSSLLRHDRFDKTKENVVLRRHNRGVKNNISKILDFETLNIKQSHIKSSHLKDLFNYIYKIRLNNHPISSLHKVMRSILLMNIANSIIEDKEYNQSQCLSEIILVVRNFARLHLKELHIKNPKISNFLQKTINFNEFDDSYYEYRVYKWFMNMFNIKIIYLIETMPKSETYDFSIHELKLDDMDVFDRYFKETH
ncbi:uncharacterized protein VNE69_01072 [Vairimorpha necatrix]|uniref:Uncharacterized protein n=1 Tax=Vairimorpha necatrix TaxID=6039 RepID=A0AAX4J841_9MICR